MSGALQTADQQWGDAQRPARSSTRFPLVRMRAIKPKLSGRYLVKGMLPSGALTVVWGAPKCGKSFWTLDVVAHIACGLPYRGLKVRQGPVVYVAAEGAEGFKARARAWCAHHLGDQDDPPLHVLSRRIDLVHEHQGFIAEIERQLGIDRATSPAAPVVVVIDTLNRTYSGSESSDQDMTAYVGAADAIKTRFNCTVIIVHHCGLEANRPRGHTALAGAADAQISIRRQRHLITAAVDFAKDMPDGYSNTSKLEKVEIGSDEDGETISTCIVVSTDEKADPGPGRPQLSAGMALAMKALEKALLTAGAARAMPGMPDNVLSVPTELWRTTFYQMCLLEAPDGNQGARQKAFRRAATDLQARQLVGCVNDHVWKVKQQGAQG